MHGLSEPACGADFDYDLHGIAVCMLPKGHAGPHTDDQVDGDNGLIGTLTWWTE